MKTTSYNIRLDPEIKAQAEETFSMFGLNLSEAITVFLHKAIRENGFPFELREPQRKYRPEVYERIDAIENGSATLERFDSWQQAKEWLNAET